MTRNAVPLGAAGWERPEAHLGWLALAVTLAPPFTAVLDGFIVIIAVPSMQRQLHASDASIQLIVAGYVAAYASLLIAGGRLGDIHGRRRLLVIGLGLFTAFSLVCAMAPDERALILARCLQGGSAALMYPQSLALIRVNSPRRRDLARAMAAWGVALGTASVAAQLLGGLLIQGDIDRLGWRTVFLVNVPIGIAVAGLARVVPESRAACPTELDLAGTAMLSGGLFALVFSLTAGREQGWPLWTWPLLGGSAALGRLFLDHERRLARLGRVPLVALDLFRGPAAAGLMTTLALYAGQVSFWLVVTEYLQRGLGLSPLATGVMTAPAAVGFFAASVMALRLAPRPSRSVPMIGALAVAVSTAGLAALAVAGAQRSAGAPIVALLFTTGAGFGAVIPTLAAAVLSVVPEDREGVASGVLVTAQQAAAAGGVVLSGVLVSGLLRGGMSYPRSLGVALILNVALFVVTGVSARTIGNAAAN